MPTYEYEHIDQEKLTCEDPFEAIQSMSEDALTKCPKCGMPVRKLISKPSFIMATNLSPESTASKGFTTYRKTGMGTYEKAGGEGPDTISAGDD
jgi:putative FmdB family regulatory protein